MQDDMHQDSPPFDCDWRQRLNSLCQDEARRHGVSHAPKWNEMVVDLRSIVEALPRSIEGFFCQPKANGAQRRKVMGLQRSFVEMYYEAPRIEWARAHNVSIEEAAASLGRQPDVALVELDLNLGLSGEDPFRPMAVE